MSKLAKRLTALLLSGMLVIGSVPVGGFAAELGQTSEPVMEEAAVEEAVTTDEVVEEQGFTGATDAPAEEYYTVTLDANGGYFANEWDDAADDYVENTEVLNKNIPVGGIIETVPVKESAAFLGWSLELDGEVLGTEYVPLDNCVLYGVWQVADESTGMADTEQEANANYEDGEAVEETEAGYEDAEEIEEIEYTEEEEVAGSGDTETAGTAQEFEKIEKAEESDAVLGGKESDEAESAIITEELEETKEDEDINTAQRFKDAETAEDTRDIEVAEKSEIAQEENDVEEIVADMNIGSNSDEVQNEFYEDQISDKGKEEIFNPNHITRVCEKSVTENNETKRQMSLANETVNNRETIKCALDSYKDYLMGKGFVVFSPFPSGFFLKDITGDGIPELIVRYGSTMDGSIEIFTYDDYDQKMLLISGLSNKIYCKDEKRYTVVYVANPRYQVSEEYEIISYEGEERGYYDISQGRYEYFNPDTEVLYDIGKEQYGIEINKLLSETYIISASDAVYDNSEEVRNAVFKQTIIDLLGIISLGTCGDNLTWILDEIGTLTISGTGEMYDYYDLSVGENRKSDAPWDSYASDIISLNIEEGVTYIGNYALYGCLNLKYITLPKTIVSIGNYAFAFCDQLKNIIIPSTVGSIEDYAFYNCTAISEIAFPASVDKIGTHAFGNCTNITEIQFKGNAPVIENNAFLAVTATAFYPSDDTTWAESVRQNYGGNIIWKEDGVWYISSFYDTPDDTWSFRNYSVNRIPLLQNEYVKLTAGMGNAEKKYVDRLISGSYGGQCYGFCVSSILEGRDILPLREIDTSTYQLYRVSKGQKTDSIIGYYFLNQFTDEQNDNLEKFNQMTPAQKINEINNSNLPFVLEFGWNSGGAHAIVGYKRENGQWTVNGKKYNYRILTYDCNHPIEDANSKGSYFYYNNSTGEWKIPNYSDADYIKRITSNIDVLRRVNANSFLSKGVTFRARNFSSANQFVVETSSGQYLISGEMVNDEITAYYDTAESMDGEECPINVLLDENKDFKVVTTNDSSLDISMLNADYCYSIESESYDSVTFDVSGGISAEGITGNYALEITSNEDSSTVQYYSFAVEGNDAGNISIDLQDDGLHISGENLVNVIITGENDTSFEELIISTDADEVLISGDEDGLQGLIDPNNDGVFDQEITDTESPISHSGSEAWDGDENGFNRRELNWKFESNGTLRIRYEGLSADETYSLQNANSYSWREYNNSILEIHIGKNVSNLGELSLDGYPKLRRIFFEYAPPTFMTDTSANSPFSGKTLEIYYPADNPAWDNVKDSNYGGTITWKPCYFGVCGNDLTWVLDSKGTLVISGSGAMYNWTDETRTPWNEHVTDIKTIVIKNGVKNIGTAAFKMCSNVSDVKIGNTVTDIGDYSFHECGLLNTIIIPGKVTNIGDAAFAFCSELDTVTIPGNVLKIGKCAFEECSKLKNVAIDSGVATIEEWAFYSCSSLVGVTIPSSVTAIGNDAFKNCSANLVISGKAESYAEKYTKEQSLVFIDPSNINYATVSGLATKTYNGKAQTQNPTVKIGTTTLKSGTDYTVSYKNNTNAGTATVTITGKGNYTGTITKTFKINKAEQSITAKASASSVTVGKTVTVSISGAKGKKSYTWLKADTDTGAVTVDSSTGKVKGTKVGIVTIKATSKATENFNAATKKVRIKVLPAATASVKADNLATGIKLTWKKVTGATGYLVYRGSTKIATIEYASTVTYTDKKANTNGTKYTYRIIATASIGKGPAKSVTTYCVARPAISSVTNSASKRMTVKWGKNSKASGYQIHYCTDKTFKSGNKSVSIKNAGTVAKVIASLTKGKTYYVRIRTYKTVGSTKYFSAWSTVKSVKISK